MSSSPLPPLPLSESKVLQIKSTITRLFERHGNSDYIGESVSQLEHALQAAHIAESSGEGPVMILAALLHDIGHLVVYEWEDSSVVFDDIRPIFDNINPYRHRFDNMGGFGVKDHENLGAEYLQKMGLDEGIPELVKSHILSKRWLSRDSSYYDKLSEASKQTLIHQGGPMTDEESEEYLKHPKHTQFTSLRLYDDGAKVVGKKTRDLEYYLDYLDRLL